MQQECIRHDFEMNGTTVEMSFEPSAVSTPLVDRKNHQPDYFPANGQFSYSQYDHYDQMQENVNVGFETSCHNFYFSSSNNAAVPFKNDNQSRQRSKKNKTNKKPVPTVSY